MVYGLRSLRLLHLCQTHFSVLPSSSFWLLYTPPHCLGCNGDSGLKSNACVHILACDENKAILVTPRPSRNEEATHGLKTHVSALHGAEAVMTERRRSEPNTERSCTASTGRAEKHNTGAQDWSQQMAV